MFGFSYKKPFSFKNALAGLDLEATTVGYSISQHIELIIFTHFGEHRFNRGYGCAIWEYDFELITSHWQWEEKFKRSLLMAISLAEPRITSVNVTIELGEAEANTFETDTHHIKKKLDVSVNAIITDTGEIYHFYTELFLGPLTSKDAKKI
jgi:phage baseplate assembly protein W